MAIKKALPVKGLFSKYRMMNHPEHFFDVDYQINGQDYTVIGSFGPNGAGPNQYDDDIYVILAGPIYGRSHSACPALCR